jgi:xanthine dehydrogenase accessory factor
MANARDFDRLAELERSGQAFALATVVGRRAPVSATLGDRAIVFADGRMEGYVGGACARDIVLTWALGALRRGRSQLLSIRPGFATERAAGEDGIDRVVVPMGCASEGAIEIYIEPHLPRRRLIVVGFTPVAEAVARVGASLDYRVTRFVLAKEVAQLKAEPEVEIFALDELGSFLEREGSDAARIAAVVASQGHYDESALERLLAIPLGYLGVLASRKRMDALRGSLTQSGVGLERLLQIRNPIGLDIGAQGPAEIALSILAEIVSLAPREAEVEENPAATAGPETVVDPICGMRVEPGGESPKLEHAGVTYYFCCDGCLRRFASEPQRHLAALERT